MKEDLGSHESFVADIDREQLFGDVVDAVVLFEPLARLLVILGELFDNVGTHVAELLLDRLGRVERLLGRNADLALLEQILHKVGDVAAADGYVFDAAADDVAVGHRDDVGDTIAAVDDDARQRSLVYLTTRPRGGQSENGL